MVKKKKKNNSGLLEKGTPAVYREILAEFWEEWGEKGNAETLQGWSCVVSCRVCCSVV